MGLVNVALLLLGSVGSVIFILLLFAGQKYDYMLEPLTGDDYPLKSIYCVGLLMQDIPLFSLRNKNIGKRMKDDATLYYGKQFGEYYTRIAWAQALSFSMLILPVMLLIAGKSSGASKWVFVLIAIVAVAIIMFYFITNTGNKLSERSDQLEAEFPNAISKLALLVNSGLTLHSAWEMVADGKKGLFYDRMMESCVKMRNGKTEVEALYSFGVYSGSDDIKKFTTALISSIERGGGSLPEFLANQSSELWAHYRQYMLQRGEKAASALLGPIGMMFAGVIIIIVAAAMLGMGI